MNTVTEPAVAESAEEAEDNKASFRLPPVLNSPIAAACLVALMTIAVFCQILGFSFTNYDDSTNVFRNPHFLPTVTAKGVGYLWTHGYYELYMPMTYTVWAICSYLFPIKMPVYVPGGGNSYVDPAAFHGLSLILHTANAVLVFAILNKLVRRPWPAAMGALLFSLHPVQVESVAWVTGMNNLISGFFGLLALWFYIRAIDGNTVSARKARLRYFIATFFYVLALLSKPTATAIPLVALAIDWFFYRRPAAKWLRALIPWILLAVCLGLITQYTSVTSKHIKLALWVRPFIAGDALAFYLTKLFFPLRLGINFGRTLALVQANWWGYVTWIFPAALGLILWRFGAKQRLLLTGMAIFVAAVLPMLGFVPYYTMEITTVSGRYLYLSMLGAGLVLAWFLSNARLSLALKGTVAGVLLIFFIAMTVQQLPYWSDTYQLAGAQIAINPNDAASQTNYGIVLASTGHPADAVPYFRTAIALNPGNAIYQYHLGTALEDSGDISGAEPVLRKSAKMDPRFSLSQIRLGGVLLKLGRESEAIEPLQKVVGISPNDSSAGYLLGIALAGANRYGEAETQFRRVLSLPGGMPEARQALGRVLEKQGKRKEAAHVYQEILKTMPDNAEAQQGLARTAKP